MTCAGIPDSEYTNTSTNWVCNSCLRREHHQQSIQNGVTGEREHNIIRFPCGECQRSVTNNHRGICCDQCNKWYHKQCAGITDSEYRRLSGSSESWMCITCRTQVNSRLPEVVNLCPVHIHEQSTNEVHHGTDLTNQQQYLYSEGWQTELLHTQSWAQKNMDQFQAKQNQWQNKKCNICNECWPTKTNLRIAFYICNRCQRDKHSPKLYSAENDMDPGTVPPCLQDMTQIEELLIARACPIMTVYHKHGGQLGYSGHVLNLPQNIQQFINKLPVNVSDLPILTVTRQGAQGTHCNFRVRRNKVVSALQWLKYNNKFYMDIEIDFDSVQRLPVDGIPDALLNFELPQNNKEPTANQGPPTEETSDDVCNNPSTSFIPGVQPMQTEEQAIRSIVAGNDPLEWPPVETTPINEFSTEGLATMVFPTLFPYGKGDPTCKGRHRAVTLAEAFKHLEHYCDILPDGIHYWRFASHPRFPYWALNMKQRHELLTQSRVYIQQHPCDANLTVEQLQEMVGTMSSI